MRGAKGERASGSVIPLPPQREAGHGRHARGIHLPDGYAYKILPPVSDAGAVQLYDEGFSIQEIAAIARRKPDRIADLVLDGISMRDRESPRRDWRAHAESRLPIPDRYHKRTRKAIIVDGIRFPTIKRALRLFDCRIHELHEAVNRGETEFRGRTIALADPEFEQYRLALAQVDREGAARTRERIDEILAPEESAPDRVTTSLPLPTREEIDGKPDLEFGEQPDEDWYPEQKPPREGAAERRRWGKLVSDARAEYHGPGEFAPAARRPRHSKAVLVDGHPIPSVAAAADFIGMTRAHVRNMLLQGKTELGGHAIAYADPEEEAARLANPRAPKPRSWKKANPKKAPAVAILVDGTEWPTFAAAAASIDSLASSLGKALRSGKTRWRGHDIAYADPEAEAARLEGVPQREKARRAALPGLIGVLLDGELFESYAAAARSIGKSGSAIQHALKSGRTSIAGATLALADPDAEWKRLNVPPPADPQAVEAALADMAAGSSLALAAKTHGLAQMTLYWHRGRQDGVERRDRIR